MGNGRDKGGAGMVQTPESHGVESRNRMEAGGKTGLGHGQQKIPGKVAEPGDPR